METLDSIHALRTWRRSRTGRVGLVPTMGALHAGHVSLVETARTENDHVITTIFVNPTQFAANEDFSKYPRDLPADFTMLERAGVDAVFTPTPNMMYPPGFQTTITVENVSKGLEGERRPGHFQGVATVVSKLFNLAQADIAYFGQKDAQQVVVIRRMVADLNMPIEIAVCPTVRESDGLAMSSRNRYLTPEQRQQANAIPRALEAAAAVYWAEERDPAQIIEAAREMLDGLTIEYIELSDPQTLNPIQGATSLPILLSLVVRMGSTRLLDNMLLPQELNTRAGLTAILGAISP